MTEQRAALLILGCAWEPYSLMPRIWWPAFRRYWTDCPYPVVWSDCASREEAWGDHAACAAESVDADAILVWMSDFILTAKVDTVEVARCLAEMRELKAGYHRVQPVPECTREFEHGLSGVHEVGAPYRASLHLAWYDRAYFVRIARGVKDPWTFETSGGDPAVPHLAVSRKNRPLSHVEAVKRGELTEDGEQLLGEIGGGDA